MAPSRAFRIWCALLLVTLVGVACSIRWIDIPVALVFLHNANHLPKLTTGFGSEVLVAGELILMAGIAITRIVQGGLPEFAKALFGACCASLTAFMANEYILKLIFGRQNPSMLLSEIPANTFSFFQGDTHASFPSGHMVMATGFAVALMRLQPRTWPILAVLLSIGAAALIIGDWHFVADVIAGAFVGYTAGLLAATLWLEHYRRP